jgi:signal transduction histidine kinase
VLCFAALTAVVAGEAVSFQARQAMAGVAAAVPSMLRSYHARFGTYTGVDSYISERLGALPVRTHTEQAGAGIRRGPPPSARETFLVRFLMVQNHPIEFSSPGQRTVIFIEPQWYDGFVLSYGIFVMAIAVVSLGFAWRIAIVVADSTLEPLLRTTAALDRFGHGDFTPAVVSTLDTSEVGDLAQAYNRAVEQITRAFEDRARGSAELRQFVADAGHQLRTPLTVIMGYLSAMASREASAQDTAAFGAMLAQSRRMKGLIDDLIVLARLEHVAPLNEAIVDLNVLCEDAAGAFGRENAGRIAVHKDRRLAEVRISKADITEALIALIDNALKYGSGSAVTIAVRTDQRDAAIEVSDAGPGFSEDDLRFAVDRFYRGSESAHAEGTGLGLSIAAKAVRRAGGHLRLSNRQGGGARCTVHLPLLVSKNEPAVPQLSRIDQATQKRRHNVSLARRVPEECPPASSSLQASP